MLKELKSEHLTIISTEGSHAYVRCRCGKQFSIARYRVSRQKSCGCLKSRAVSRTANMIELRKRIKSVMDTDTKGKRIQVMVREMLGLTENPQVILRHIRIILKNEYNIDLNGKSINAHVSKMIRFKKIIAILVTFPNTHGLAIETYLSTRLEVPESRIISDLHAIKKICHDPKGNFYLTDANKEWNKDQSSLPHQRMEELQQGVFSRASGMQSVSKGS